MTVLYLFIVFIVLIFSRKNSSYWHSGISRVVNVHIVPNTEHLMPFAVTNSIATTFQTSSWATASCGSVSGSWDPCSIWDSNWIAAPDHWLSPPMPGPHFWHRGWGRSKDLTFLPNTRTHTHTHTHTQGTDCTARQGPKTLLCSDRRVATGEGRLAQWGRTKFVPSGRGKGKEGDGKGKWRREGEWREGRGRTTCIPHYF